MGWSNVPPDLGDDIQAWQWVRQFWEALRERGYCLAQTPFFARVANSWHAGTIAAATSTSITDAAAQWAPGRWTSDGGYPWLPDRYDLIIPDPDPRKVQRLPIVANDATTLSFAEADWHEPAHYVGRRYEIVTGWGPEEAPWVHERMPTGPNDRPLDGGVASGGDAATLADAAKAWEPSQWAGKHLVVEQAGRSRRGVIAGNAETTLTFAGQGWPVAAGQRYAIVEPAAVYEFGRVPDPIYQWCGSPTEPWLTHAPEDDAVTTTRMPYLTRHLPDRAEPVTVFDADVWTEVDDELDTPDKCYTPHVFKTIRGLQLACELLCTGFVEPVDHTGRNAIENFNLATFFECLSINAASATVTAVDLAAGKTHFAPGIAGMFLEDGHGVTIACLDGHKVRWVRQATLRLAANAATLDFAVSEDDVGKRLAFAFGWTRKLPREFVRFYRQSVFVPDHDIDAGEPALPPTASYPGTWQHLGPSDHYKSTSALGFVGDSADGHDVIQDGELARYSGQNWNDPTLGIQGTDTDDPLAHVRNTQYVGRKRPGWSFGDAGTVSAGGTWWLRDGAKSWFAEGTLVEHVGTATAGSATSLTDSTKAADPFWATAGLGRFAEHVLEVTTGPRAGTRVPIDGSAGTTLTFRDLGFSTAGLGYRIREPAYELNRWQGRLLRVTRADGTTLADIAITHSDDDTLYFAAQAEAIQPGWTYRIVAVSTGTVWLRQAGKWVVPPPETHGRNPFAVRPTVVRRYGRYTKGDYLPAGLFDELRRAIDLMRHVARPASWSAFAEPWVDAPLASGVADGGGEGFLIDPDATFGPQLVGKHVQVRSWATGGMSRFTITGVDGSTLSFEGAGFAAGWGDDYWVLEPAARDVVPNDRVVADSVGGGNVNDWLDQYGRAAGDWAAPRYPGQRPRVVDGKAPRCLTLGSDYQGLNEPSMYYYSAALHGTHAYGRADLPYRNWDGATFTVQTDFYGFADHGQPRVLPPHEAQFIANGEVGQLQRWVKFDTTASRTDGNPTISRRFGDVTTCPAAGQAPPPPPEPDGSTTFDTANGYLVADAKVVMRFETSGLLTFL